MRGMPAGDALPAADLGLAQAIGAQLAGRLHAAFAQGRGEQRAVFLFLQQVLAHLALQPGRRIGQQLMLQGLLRRLFADQVDAQQQQLAGAAGMQLAQGGALDAVDQEGLQAWPAAQLRRGEQGQGHDAHGAASCCWALRTRPMKLSWRNAWAAAPACG
ncbi:hypothetical protein D3C78_1340070 [compost metagenome]